MIHLDIPYPPSVNLIWRTTRKGRHYLDPKYQAWRVECDRLWMAAHKAPRPKVEGRFGVLLWFDETRRRKNTDLDNRIKAVLDWLQRAKVIENDALCDDLGAFWMAGTPGCRVFLWPAAEGRPVPALPIEEVA